MIFMSRIFPQRQKNSENRGPGTPPAGPEPKNPAFLGEQFGVVEHREKGREAKIRDDGEQKLSDW
jgi:hypothetical protein